MGAGPRYSPEPDPYEFGPGMAERGPTGGQVAFDLLFGVVAPAALLVTDPALFSASVARRAALPPYWALPTYVAQGTLIFLLLLWGVSGMRGPRLGLLLAGPFAVGALMALGLGAVLLPFAITHSDFLSGWVAFTPWLTAYVFIRHTVLASRAGSERSGPWTLLAFLATSAALLAALGTVGVRRERQARLIEGLLLSRSEADYKLGCSLVHDPRVIDWDRVATLYEELPEDDARRPRIREAHLRFAGAPVEQALQRLSPYVPPPKAAKPKSKAPDEPADSPDSLLRLLFSEDVAEHAAAADKLLLLLPDRQTLDQIVRRYGQLNADDPRRPFIEKAYRHLSGEPIDLALKRLEKSKPPVKGKEPEPPPEPPAKPAK